MGFELLPGLHLAFHDEAAPHAHVGEMIITVTYGEVSHRHDDGTYHTHVAGKRQRQHDGRSRARTPLEHAASLAHHATAAIPTVPPLHQPLPVDRRPTIVAALAQSIPPIAYAVAARARGPPSHLA